MNKNMTYINTRADGVAGNVTGTVSGTKRALDVNLATAIDSSTDSITTVPQPQSTIGCGRQTVSPVGTEVKLYATPTTCKIVYVQALYANTGYISVGTTPVVAAAGSETGIKLAAGEKLPLEIDDISKIYIDGTVHGEGVSYIYLV